MEIVGVIEINEKGRESVVTRSDSKERVKDRFIRSHKLLNSRGCIDVDNSTS